MTWAGVSEWFAAFFGWLGANWTDWLPAAAALIAAVAVIWQSVETRRSAQAGKRSADVAQESLKAANRSVEVATDSLAAANASVAVATDSLALARRQAADAVKAHLDQDAPTITVVAQVDEDRPVFLEAPHGSNYRPEHVQIDPSPEPLILPRDEDKRLTSFIHVTIRNDSDRHVALETRGFEDPDQEPSDPARVLGPGEGVLLELPIDLTVQEWVRRYRERTEPDLTTAGATIAREGGSDFGTVDTWVLSYSGTLVEPAPGVEDGWLAVVPEGRGPGSPTGIDPGQPVQTRTYYQSKRDGILLPEV